MYRYAAFALVLCAACKSPPSARGGGPNPMVEPLASAWCQHHNTCGRVAASKRFENLESCMQEVRERVTEDLHGCAANDAKLSACLASIEAKTCDAFRVVTPDDCDRLCD